MDTGSPGRGGGGEVLPTPFMCIHHVGICVRHLHVALDQYMSRLGLVMTSSVVETQEVRGCLIRVGEDLLEIIEPRGPEGLLARFLERRGEGLHHIAYQVGDIEATLADIERRGGQLIDRAPRPGLQPGWRIAFIHPESAGGVLTELVQVDQAALGPRQGATPGAS